MKKSTKTLLVLGGLAGLVVAGGVAWHEFQKNQALPESEASGSKPSRRTRPTAVTPASVSQEDIDASIAAARAEMDQGGGDTEPAMFAQNDDGSTFIDTTSAAEAASSVFA